MISRVCIALVALAVAVSAAPCEFSNRPLASGLEMDYSSFEPLPMEFGGRKDCYVYQDDVLEKGALRNAGWLQEDGSGHQVCCLGYGEVSGDSCHYGCEKVAESYLSDNGQDCLTQCFEVVDESETSCVTALEDTGILYTREPSISAISDYAREGLRSCYINYLSTYVGAGFHVSVLDIGGDVTNLCCEHIGLRASTEDLQNACLFGCEKDRFKDHGWIMLRDETECVANCYRPPSN